MVFNIMLKFPISDNTSIFAVDTTLFANDTSLLAHDTSLFSVTIDSLRSSNSKYWSCVDWGLESSEQAIEAIFSKHYSYSTSNTNI